MAMESQLQSASGHKETTLRTFSWTEVPRQYRDILGVKLFTATLCISKQSVIGIRGESWCDGSVTGSDYLWTQLWRSMLSGESLSKVQITFLNPHHSPGKQTLSFPHCIIGRYVRLHRRGT